MFLPGGAHSPEKEQVIHRRPCDEVHSAKETSHQAVLCYGTKGSKERRIWICDGFLTPRG